MKNKAKTNEVLPMTQTEAEAIRIEEATKVLTENEEKRQKACIDEVNEVLKKHGYRLSITNKVDLVRN